MRRKDREIRDQAEARGILAKGKFAAIALCKDGEPYVVTMSYGFDASRNSLYFHCAREGQKIDFIRSNPAACATVVEDLGYRTGECLHAYRSVVIRGRLGIVEGIDEKKHAFTILIRHLETDPEPMIEKTLKNPKALEDVGILRLDIEDISAKAGS